MKKMQDFKIVFEYWEFSFFSAVKILWGERVVSNLVVPIWMDW